MASGSDLNPLVRFTDRVGDYVRFRPSYPAALIAFLRSRTGLGPGSSAADVGSGTGIFTGLLLETGARVFAIEPNDAMRGAAEAALAGRANFTSVAGTAEATGLPAGSVSLVTSAQAFHWFDPAPTGREFRRILAPGGWCALVWNTVIPDRSEFARGYERIKEGLGSEFRKVRQENRRSADRFAAVFGSRGWERHVFPNFQELDFDGLIGRLRSSSYAPKEGHPAYEPTVAALRRLFDRFQENGRVRMEYETELFLGRPVGD